MDWTIFFVTYLYTAGVLYIPGYLYARTFGIKGAWALGIAPLLTSGMLCLVGEIAFRLHIPMTPMLLAGVVTLIALAAFGLTQVIVYIRRQSILDMQLPQISRLLPVAYALVGIGVTYFLYISMLSNPTDTSLSWDMVQHFGTTRTMLSEGIFSSFYAGSYMSKEAAFAPWDVTKPAMYPAAWNIICAVGSLAAQSNLAITANAFNAVVCSLVFPLSIMNFIAYSLETISNGIMPVQLKHVIRWAGALTSSVFIIFPWSDLVFGPLLPFILGLSMSPQLAWLWMYFVHTWNHYRQTKGTNEQLRFLLLFLFCIFALAFNHPSTIFSCAVFIIPWTIQTLWSNKEGYLAPRFCCITRYARNFSQNNEKLTQTQFVKEVSVTQATTKKALSGKKLAVIFTLLCALIWVTAWQLIAKRGALSAFYWEAYTSVPGALKSILGMSFVNENFPGRGAQTPQPMLSVLVFLGLWLAIKKYKRFGFAFSWICTALICLYITAFNLPGKSFLTGFWYTDPQRVGANAAILSILFAAHGLGYVVYKLARLISEAQRRTKTTSSRITDVSISKLVMTGLLVGCITIAGLLYTRMPTHAVSTPIRYQEAIRELYASSDLSPKEMHFLKRVKTILKERGYAPIVNNPYDGSVVAYGIESLPCVYRHPVTFEDEREQTRIIREKLVHYQVHPEVIEALKQTGIRYVLQLEDPGFIPFSQNYHKPDYAGIDHISDRTPGFKVLAADGDMRLYEITDIH